MRTNQQRLRRALSSGERMFPAGYTLIEVTVVGLLIGLLCAIAFPSWLAFYQRQQIRFAATQLRKALDIAKSEASLRSVRYAVTACSHPSDSGQTDWIKYSIHPYDKRPYWFTTLEKVSLVKSTIRRSPARYNLHSLEYGDCYTTYLGLFPSAGYSLGFFYLSNDQQTYVYRVGFNTLIGNIISCPVLSLEKNQCK